MPEGDTIFRSARALHRALAGKQVAAFETAYAPLARVNDDSPLAGRIIESVEARGKWLLMHFSGNLILVTHMLMSGSWHLYRHGEKWRRPGKSMRIRIAVGDFEAVAFDVPVARFHTADSLARQSAIPKLGPDLLGTEFPANEAVLRLQSHAGEEVANALLNQQIVAGIGNVFKSEVCFVCGIDPFRLVSTLSDVEAQALVDSARRLMQANVGENASGSITTYSGARRTTGADNPGARLWVYRRQGKPCRRCGSAILMRKQGSGARSTYWCPTCQR
jgi:endonuclease VIII